MEQYSHRERIQMIIAGEKPDRFAASFWRHFFHMENSAEGTAEAMLFFQKKFDWDFMKINPRADYHIQDFGFKMNYSTDEFVKHIKVDFPIEKPEDWDKIEKLDSTAPVLAEHLKMVSLIRKGTGDDLPLLMTVFTPLAVAGRMVRDDKLLADHIRTCPDKVERALKAITATYVEFVSELRNAGADGIFYATTQWASSNLITWEDYQRFGVPYDLQVIKAAESDAINLLHICSSNNFLNELTGIDYSCALYNWDSQDPTNIPLDLALDLPTGKAIVGGVDHQGWLLKGTPPEVGYKIDELKEASDPSRLIIGPGCSIEPEVKFENLQAIRDKL